MVEIVQSAEGRPRLIARDGVTPAQFHEIAARLGQKPRIARKSGFVAARAAETRRRVVTRWNGVETENEAAPGDIVVTNLSADKEPLRDDDGQLNVYVIPPARFDALYEPVGERCAQGEIHRARGTVAVLALPGGFELLGPWGEMQRADDGLLVLNEGEVYGAHRAAFERSYEILAEPE